MNKIDTPNLLIFEKRIAGKVYATPKELSEFLNVPIKTIYGWIYQNKIPYIRIGPRLIRFDLVEIEKWISSKRRTNGN